MTTILDQLHTDHTNAVKLLEHFEKELDQFRLSDSVPNYLNWQNILLYMTTYQDVFHHPAEEMLFTHLSIDEPEIIQTINEIESQHELLYTQNKNLHEMLGSVETSFISLEKNDLIKTCKDYIQQILKHMSLEEKLIFPLAKKKMSEADWRALDKEIVRIDDPLFSQKRKIEFTELYQCLFAN